MKRLLLIIAFVAVFILGTSGYNENRFGTQVGDNAPALVVSNSIGKTSLDDCRGKYVLLSFWNSNDALSRTGVNSYQTWVNSCKKHSEKIALIAVNLEDDTQLFSSIVKLDNLDSKCQFNVKGDEALKIREDFKIYDNMGTLLIDTDGKILAINPSVQLLNDLLS